MTAAERDLRLALVAAGRHLSARGLSPGSSGNLSVRHGDLLLITPTGVGLHALGPDDIALVGLGPAGGPATGPRPSKELPLHRAVYAARPDATAVVHLHAPSSTAASCVPPDAWPGGTIPWLTPYQVMKVGEIGRVPYAPPGSAVLADAVAVEARDHRCLLLANHGSVVAGSSLDSAVEVAEELEAGARLLLTLRGLPFTTLTDEQVAELRTPRT